MTTTHTELTALDVTERTGGALFLGWDERPTCTLCGTPTRLAAPNLAWTGTACERGCCTGPTMPQCASCTPELAPDVREELANLDREAAR